MKSPRSFLLSFAAATVLGGAAALYAQTPAPGPVAAKPADAAPAKIDKSLLDYFHEGGPIMYLIVLCSIATVYLAIDGVVRTSKVRVVPPPQVDRVRDYFRQGDYVGAYNFCRTQKSPFANVCRVGISMLGEGKTPVEEAVLQELQKESSQMGHYISYLSVIGVCTPMIGLIGTVSGMISAFDTLGTSGIGDPSKLSAAIGEVLVATFSGLLIAVPAFGLYYFLRNRSAKAIHDVQDTMNSLFRKMPYEQLAGAHIGGEEIYAATPNWVVENEAVAAQVNA
jgi:biopolymer transport protein ExbB